MFLDMFTPSAAARCLLLHNVNASQSSNTMLSPINELSEYNTLCDLVCLVVLDLTASRFLMEGLGLGVLDAEAESSWKSQILYCLVYAF